MKKIQVSTITKNAEVEVLFVNANLISKAIRASITVNEIIERAKAEGCIIPRYNAPMDENGNPIVNDKGIVETTPVLDEKGNQIIDYSSIKVYADALQKLNEEVNSFLTELTKAFEE